MVVILSDRENKTEKEIIRMLSALGAAVISDGKILETGSSFTVVASHRKTQIKAKSGIVIATDGIKKFKNQRLPRGVIGICSESNMSALDLFKKNGISVITCGVGTKNTLSVSSINENGMLLCLQRSIIDANGCVLEPCELKIKPSGKTELFSCLAAEAVRLIYNNEAYS